MKSSNAFTLALLTLSLFACSHNKPVETKLDQDAAYSEEQMNFFVTRAVAGEELLLVRLAEGMTAVGLRSLATELGMPAASTLAAIEGFHFASKEKEYEFVKRVEEKFKTFTVTYL